MKPFLRPFCAALAALLLAPVASAQRSDILPPARRQTSVDAALRITRPPVAEPLPINWLNPFAPAEPEPEPEPVVQPTGNANPPTPRVSTTAEILRIIAPQLNPSGTMILGGKPLLLFGSKKVQQGDRLPVDYEGRRYNLRITDIQASFFTIELDGAALTRPIKNDN